MTQQNFAGHDPVKCESSICQRCEDYAHGYERGKVKAYFEIEIGDDRHPLECGCVPCRIVRGIVAKVLNSRPAPLDGEVKVFIAR